jgi:hypothetical protein
LKASKKNALVLSIIKQSRVFHQRSPIGAFFYFRAEKQTIQSCSFGLPHTGTVSSGFGGGTCLVGRLGSFWIGIYLHLHWEKGLVPLTKIRLHFFATIHWIGLRGNIQESPTFDEKNTSCI